MENSLEQIELFCLSLKESPQDYDKLLSLVNFSLIKDEFDFEQSCEALVPILYFALTWNINAKSIDNCLQYFIHKCYEWDKLSNLAELISILPKKLKITSLGTVILLNAHYNSQSLSDLDIEKILSLSSPKTLPPSWIREIISCSNDEDPYKFLNHIFSYSISIKSNVYHEFDNYYLRSLYLFLTGCKKYISGNYGNSLEIFQSIKVIDCSDHLLGMIHLFSGTNYEKLGKPQLALLEYRKSFNFWNGCWLSLYYSARLLKRQGYVQGCLDTLDIICEINLENEQRSTSFQGMLLNFHFPIETNISSRAEHMLAVICFSEKIFGRAREYFSELYSKYSENNKLEKLNSSITLKSALPNKDHFPHVPDLSCIKMEYALSLIVTQDYEEAEILLRNIEIDDLPKLETEHQNEDYHMNSLATIASLLLLAEVLYVQGKPDDAMNKLIKLLIDLETTGAQITSTWNKIYILIKSNLYMLLSVIFNKYRFHEENYRHYRRLGLQCRDIWNNTPESDLNNELYSLIVENLVMYFKPNGNIRSQLLS